MNFLEILALTLNLFESLRYDHLKFRGFGGFFNVDFSKYHRTEWVK